MISKSLDVSDLTLLKFQPPEGEEPGRATVFATESGIRQLRNKLEQFGGALPLKTDGTEKRPRNADLAQSIGAIVEAGLRALWRSPPARFPASGGAVPWEVWLAREQAHTFIDGAAGYGVTVASDRIEFPEDIVVIATATAEELALAVRRLGAVRALAVPVTTAEFFDELVPEEQTEWVDDLAERTIFAEGSGSYVTLLDTGVSRAHPLIEPALDVADRHAAHPAWGVDDGRGHGTQLAGLALYGDLTLALQSPLVIAVDHRLESAKIIPDAGTNPHHLLGKLTVDGIAAVEANATRRRSFVLATTTDQDTPHSGAPTSWSSVLDQLSAGAGSGEPRLILVSAGNSDQNRFDAGPYLSVADHPDNEIESPAQAWNTICVGAYTEKSVLPPGVPGSVVAPVGDLSPSSRTASWTSIWPIKPDIVLEGGNWLLQPPPPPLQHSALNVLTTSRDFPARAFSAIGNTSAATALAARDIARLLSEYPALWPEAVRAVYVGSARWTPQMLSHLPPNPSKGSYDPLFKRYGFGVPDIERARRSASNAVTLIVQDRIIPYRVGKTNAKGLPTQDHLNNEMRMFRLPWPVEALQVLGASQVTLRVALSTFIEPNPAEAARGFKYRYGSHNLRFKLNRADESEQTFMARINAAADSVEDSASIESDGWTFGRNRRDVGSLQVDELTCPASDLARRHLLAVHPIAGWWKLRAAGDPSIRSARFALVVEIDAGEHDVDLYSEVETAIANQVAAAVVT